MRSDILLPEATGDTCTGAGVADAEGDAGVDSALRLGAAAAPFRPFCAASTWTSRFIGEWPCRSRKVGDKAAEKGAEPFCGDTLRLCAVSSAREADGGLSGTGRPAVAPEAGMIGKGQRRVKCCCGGGSAVGLQNNEAAAGGCPVSCPAAAYKLYVPKTAVPAKSHPAACWNIYWLRDGRCVVRSGAGERRGAVDATVGDELHTESVYTKAPQR